MRVRMCWRSEPWTSAMLHELSSGAGLRTQWWDSEWRKMFRRGEKLKVRPVWLEAFPEDGKSFIKAQYFRGFDSRTLGQPITGDWCREQGQVPAAARAPHRCEWHSQLCIEKGVWHSGLFPVRDIGQRWPRTLKPFINSLHSTEN